MVAVVVVGFCAHEITWKAKRLQRDLRDLQGLADQIIDLRGQLAVTQERLAATGLR
jgi:hypothetical protein